MTDERKPQAPPEFGVLDRARTILDTSTRADRSVRHLELSLSEGVLTVEGEAEDIASKKRAVHGLQTVPEIRWVIDHVRVKPGVPMQDGELRDHVREALEATSEFEECRLVVAHDGVDETTHDPGRPRGSIHVRASDGVVSLEGRVPSWSHRRLAGVLAWWVPGTRDVENRLAVAPPEQDSDDEVVDAVRIALERDPLIDASQIRARGKCGRLTLSGTARSDEQRRTAERDAWYVLGVEDVANEIAVVQGAEAP